MKPEILETLLIDRALGRHSPEVEALLAEHLATDPEAARTAAELHDVVALATTVLRRPAPQLTPPPRLAGVFWFRSVNRALALAAAFVVGAGVALLANRTIPQKPPLAQVVTQPPVAPVAKAPSPKIVREAKVLPFWSQRRAYLLAEAAKDSTR